MNTTNQPVGNPDKIEPVKNPDRFDDAEMPNPIRAALTECKKLADEFGSPVYADNGYAAGIADTARHLYDTITSTTEPPRNPSTFGGAA